MISEVINKVYYTLGDIAQAKGLKPRKVKYILDILEIPYARNRRGSIKIHYNEVKRYFNL